MSRFALATALLVLLPLRVSATDERAADALIARGLEFRREDKPAEALEMFRRAHALAPSPRTLGQIGLAETALDRWIDAEEHLTGSLASAEDGWVRKNRASLDQALAIARTHIGSLTFAGPAGATVTVAGRTAGKLPLLTPVRVGEGTVLVTASAPGFKQFINSATVRGGTETTVTIALEPLEVPPPRSPPPLPVDQRPSMSELRPQPSWRAWTGGSLVVGGAGLLGWGIVWLALDGHDAGGTCASPSVGIACKPVYNTRTTGWILTGVGAAAAATGGVLLYTARTNGTDVTLGLGTRSIVVGGRF